MKKFLIVIISILLMTTFVLSGCGKKRRIPDTDSTLEIYVFDAGYGVEWANNLIELFKKQPWVKEKYPELAIYKQENDDATFAESRMQAGSNNNTIDLFFTVNGALLAGKDDRGNDKLLDLTETVYDQLVPGEEIYYKDKILSSYMESNRFLDPLQLTQDEIYYMTPWAGGMDGILYNEDILKSLDIKVPNTTDELYAACERIMSLKDNELGLYNKGFSFIQSKDEAYWDYLFPIWWAQYQGMQGYYNFWNGIDNNRISKNIFNQLGRLEALKIYESLLDYSKGFITPSSSTYEFMVAQTMFLQGYGVFNVNGDWFDNEMRKIKNDIKEEDGIDHTIKIMRTPIVSSIRELTPSITSDELLSKVVDAVDSGADSYSGVDDVDFQKIVAARSIVHSIGPNHTSVIPAYAKGKDIAVDFLRFMATDIACESYIQSTSGASLPFKYNLKEKSVQTYNSLSPMQKDRIDYFENGYFELDVLPIYDKFPLARFGGLREVVRYNYYEVFKTNGNTITAQDIFDETKEVWTDSKWRFALGQAGIFG